MRKIGIGLLVLSLMGLVTVVANVWNSEAAEEATGGCCKPGDSTPPPELVKNTPKGQLKSPYQDFAGLVSSWLQILLFLRGRSTPSAIGASPAPKHRAALEGKKGRADATL
jgi:hypothetical protein